MMLTFDDDQAAALLTALGLPADETDAEAVAATAKDMAAQLDGMNPDVPSTVAAAAKRHGCEMVDGQALAALHREVTEARQIKAAAAQAKIEASVDDAIRNGKITPARRKHWVALIEADPAMADVLASTPNETAIPLSEIGHGISAEDNDQLLEWFR